VAASPSRNPHRGWTRERGPVTLLVLVVIVVGVRAILDRSLYSQYDFRAILPRALVGVIVMHASLYLIQMAIDLNNALTSFAAGAGGGSMPWTDPLSSSALASSSLAQDLFLATAAQAPGSIAAIGSGLVQQARRIPLPLPARGA